MPFANATKPVSARRLLPAGSLWLALAALAALTAARAAAGAAPTPPASQPEGAQPGQPGQIGRIIKAAESLRAYRWTLVETWTFQQPGSAKGWTFVGPAGQIKAGRLVVEGNNFLMEAALPKDLATAAGVRVDLWVELTSSGDLTQRVGIFVGPRPAVPDVAAIMTDMATPYYEFCHGETGRLQQFIYNGGNPYTKFEPMPWGKPVHVSFEVVGGNLRGQRDGCPALEWGSDAAVKLNDASRVGLRGRCGEFRLLAMSVRKATGGWDAAAYEKALRQAGFDGGQAELDAFLRQQVLGRLADRSFKIREQATEWLRLMQPLSLLAIQEAVWRVALSGASAAQGAQVAGDAELGQRLMAIRQSPPPVHTEPCTLDEAPPGYVPPAAPPTSQPEAK